MQPIPDFDKYFATADGKIFSEKSGTLRQLSQHMKKNYWAVNLAGKKHVMVHQLVCAAFHGRRPPGHEVRHFNGVKTDNRSVNLLWGTQDENLEDNVRLGIHKLNHQKVAEIRAALVSGKSTRAIAMSYGVTVETVRLIATHATWKTSGITSEYLGWLERRVV